MVLIAKSFLVKVLMEVQKKLYLSSYFLLRKGTYPQCSTESGYVCVCRGGNYEAAKVFLMSISFVLSLFLTAVVFVCCSPDIFRQLMVHFHRAGLPKEEYVFFYIDIFGRSLEARPSRPWARGDSDDDLAKEAFKVIKAFHKT